jgi:hypothetical protein
MLSIEMSVLSTDHELVREVHGPGRREHAAVVLDFAAPASF